MVYPKDRVMSAVDIGKTYKQSTLKMMMITSNLKMLAMPRAKQRIMERIPSLCSQTGSLLAMLYPPVYPPSGCSV